MYGEAIKGEIAVDLDKRIIVAYAAIFNNRDEHGHRVAPGAFAKSIAERQPSGQIKLFRDHWQLIGHPVVLREDSTGLYSESYVSRTAYGDETLEMVKDGTLNRYSFRADIIRGRLVIDGQSEDGIPIETFELTELRLKEIGPVDLLPANPLAQVIGVKSAGEALDRIAEMPVALAALSRIPRDRWTPEEVTAGAQLVETLKALHPFQDVFSSLLAPEASTSLFTGGTPPPTTPARAVEEAELAVLADAIAKFGQLYQPTT
jgi:HK97 family phage prohead protease